MIKSIVIIFSVFLILKGYKLYKFLKLNVKKIPKVSFEEQLKWFQDFGFQLNDGISKEDLLAFYGTASEYENQPWELLYITFGYTAEREPWIPLTNDCWHFDTECIEGSGSSIEILENLKRISKNELNFKNIKDFIDFENGKAWVSFEFNDGGQNWPKNFFLKTKSVEVILYQLIEKGIASYNKDNPFFQEKLDKLYGTSR